MKSSVHRTEENSESSEAHLSFPPSAKGGSVFAGLVSRPCEVTLGQWEKVDGPEKKRWAGVVAWKKQKIYRLEEEGGAGGQEEKGTSRTTSCPMKEFCNGELRVRRENMAWRGRSFRWEATESVAAREDF